MKQFSSREFGPISTFDIVDVPVPEPGFGELRVKVAACALGFVDGLIAAGQYQLKPALPHVPGGEIAGVVEAVGGGVTDFIVGQRVYSWQLGGGFAEYVIIPAKEVHQSPPGIDPATVAAMIIDFPTAHYALFERGNLRPFEKVLILGAAGGVGIAAVQLAKAAGAYVVAAASTAAKRKFALSVGADATIDSTSAGWRQELNAAGPYEGCDIVVDPVGGDLTETAFRSLRKEGRHLVIGFATGGLPRLPTNLALLKSAALIGVDVRHFVTSYPQQARVARERMFELVQAGRIGVPIDRRFALAEAKEAFARLNAPDRTGKIVVSNQPSR